MNIGEMVAEFHEAIGHEPTVDGNFDLIEEEFAELWLEMDKKPRCGDCTLKEAADLVYVTVGLMQALGADPDTVLEAVHVNNLGKRVAGHLSPAGKWVKPDDYPKPSLRCRCGEYLHVNACEDGQRNIH